MTKINVYENDIPIFLEYADRLPDEYVNAIAPRHLTRLMKDCSEFYYHARNWLNDLEFILWAVIQGHQRKRSQMSNEEVEQLRKLSEICNGWVVYDALGGRLTSMDEWLPMYDEWRKEKGV